MSNRGLSGIAHDEGRKRAATLMGGGGGGNVRGGSVRGAGMGMGTGTGKAGKGDSGGIGMGIGEEDKPLIPEQMSFSMRFALEEHMGGRGK